jgi:uncharacterized membrane protein
VKSKPKPAKASPRAKGSGGALGGRRKAAAASRKSTSSARSVAEPAAERTKSAAASARRTAEPAAERTAERAKSAASSLRRTISSASSLLEGGGLRRKATKEGLHLAALLARHGARAGARAAGKAVSRAGAAGAEALLERAQRMPIQQSIDVAVPPEIAWEQWMEFSYFPEGTRRVVDVERDGDTLEGHLDGLTSRDWEAEIIDERECESFAWRTTEGADSAGLVTFHQLAERLTRIELNLDVRPTDLGEAAGLALRLADHRVRSELRRFKAHAELLSPDIYDELLGSSSNGDSPEYDDDSEYEDDSEYDESDEE